MRQRVRCEVRVVERNGEDAVAARERLVDLVRAAGPHIARNRVDTEEWLSRLEGEASALNQLVDESLRDRPVTGAELASALWPWWWSRGHQREGRGFLERAVMVETTDAELWKGLGTIAFKQGDNEVAATAFERRHALVEHGTDRGQLADAYADLARVALRREDFEGVERYADQGYAAAEGLDAQYIRQPLHMRAAAARMQGHLAQARALYLQSRDLNEQVGNTAMVACEDHNLVYVELHSGNLIEARRRFELSSSWIFANDNAYLKPYSLVDAAVLAARDGDLHRSICLLARAWRVFEETDAIPDPDDHIEVDRLIDELHSQLGDDYDGLWHQGRMLDLGEAQRIAATNPP
jgi:non-specific serine/threonine protein kinase